MCNQFYKLNQLTRVQTSETTESKVIGIEHENLINERIKLNFLLFDDLIASSFIDCVLNNVIIVVELIIN